jgi:hypothetical protein
MRRAMVMRVVVCLRVAVRDSWITVAMPQLAAARPSGWYETCRKMSGGGIMRPTWTWFALTSVLAVHALGCGSTEMHACTTEARASLTVTVLGPSGRICDANVVAQKENEVTTMMAFGGPECTYAGPYEQAGTFTVTASKDGFQSATTTVTVTAGECHVEGRQVTLTLAPQM